VKPGNLQIVQGANSREMRVKNANNLPLVKVGGKTPEK